MNVAITSSSLRKEKKRNHQPAVDASSNEFIVFEFWCYRFLLFKKKKIFFMNFLLILALTKENKENLQTWEKC